MGRRLVHADYLPAKRGLLGGIVIDIEL